MSANSDKLGKMGPSAILEVPEERMLAKYVLDMAQLGCPLNKQALKDSVQKILRHLQRPNPFKDDRPGETWYKSFLNRNPAVRLKHAEIISKARAAVTETSIRAWFAELRSYLEDEQALDVLMDPSRIFNLDETGVSMCPKSGKVLSDRKQKNTYKVATGPEKESITVMCCFGADGTVIDPMIVYPYKTARAEITKTIPGGFAYGNSSSGWMNAELFNKFIMNIFYPQVVETQTKFPIF